MNMFFKSTVAIVALAGFAAPALAQNSAQAASSTNIIVPISITNATGLQFGTIARPASSTGTVTINATTGARTFGGNVALVSSTSGRATFDVDGDASRAFSAVVPANFILGNGTPADNITVTLTSDVPASLNASGEALIGVGGTFTIGSTQTLGAYTGNFTVSVSYN